MQHQNGAPKKQERCLFIVWKGYQRRAEVLGPLFDADVKYVPHLFKNKWLRPFDYLYKLLVTMIHIARTKPTYAIVQAPPHYAALPALLMGLPYIVDAHNGVFQSYWHRLPLFNLIMKKSKAIIVHNDEVLELFGDMFPSNPYFVVSDPIGYISVANTERRRDQILFICSFDPDEPIDVIIDVIERSPDYTFVITAQPHKLSPTHRKRLEATPNVNLTGFLSTKDYHTMLCSSTASIALTTMVATQQSGACEALSSDTPLIATKSSLSEKLFGEWAILVDNSASSIVDGIHQLDHKALDLRIKRNSWNEKVNAGVAQVKEEVLGIKSEIKAEVTLP